MLYMSIVSTLPPLYFDEGMFFQVVEQIKNSKKYKKTYTDEEQGILEMFKIFCCI